MNMTNVHQFDRRTTDHEQHLSGIPIRQQFTNQLISNTIHETDSSNSINPTSHHILHHNELSKQALQENLKLTGSRINVQYIH
jgi:hypothetical protein